VQALQDRQGMLISSPEEIAWRMRFIDTAQLEQLGQVMRNNQVGQTAMQ
jgi:glucose-1-phosphate thymidylyltransferase